MQRLARHRLFMDAQSVNKDVSRHVSEAPTKCQLGDLVNSNTHFDILGLNYSSRTENDIRTHVHRVTTSEPGVGCHVRLARSVWHAKAMVKTRGGCDSAQIFSRKYSNNPNRVAHCSTKYDDEKRWIMVSFPRMRELFKHSRQFIPMQS